jgi:AraC-like DNA-binding protein
MRAISVLTDTESIGLTNLHYFTAPRPFRSGGMPAAMLDFVLITAGCLWVEGPDGVLSLRAGDCAFRGPHLTGVVYTEAPVTLFHGYFTIAGGRIDVLDAQRHTWIHTLTYAPDPAPYLRMLAIPDVLHLEHSGELEAMLHLMRRLREEAAPGCEWQVQAEFLRVLHYVTQTVITTLKQESSMLDTPVMPQHIRRAVAYIEEHLAQPLSLRDVARHLDMNPDYLGRLFARSLGKSVGAYLVHRRLAIARHLLATTPLSVKQVALRVGIVDPLYFSRLFRRATGMTPTAYQQAHQDVLSPRAY